MMEYKIVYAFSVLTLESRVNEAIGDGWTPQGGVSEGSSLWTQAMVRPKPASQNLQQS